MFIRPTVPGHMYPQLTTEQEILTQAGAQISICHTHTDTAECLPQTIQLINWYLYERLYQQHPVPSSSGGRGIY